MIDRPIDLSLILGRHFHELQYRIDLTDNQGNFLTPRDQYASIQWGEGVENPPTLEALVALWPETLEYVMGRERASRREGLMRGRYPSFQDQIIILARAVSTGDRTTLNEFLAHWDSLNDT